MSVDEPDNKLGDNSQVPTDSGAEERGDVEGPALPENPDLTKAMEEALASLEKRGKKNKGDAAEAQEMSPKERESLQGRIKELHLKMMEKTLEIEEKTKEIEKYKDQAARRQADLENYKKRVQKERAEQFNYGNEEIAREFLDVLDNLERAITHGAADVKGLLDGVELTRKLMEQIFQKFGVEPIKTLGEKFNPNLHQAVAQIPSPEHEPGTIINEQQRGYRLKDRLLRPSMVIVAGPAQESEHSDT